MKNAPMKRIFMVLSLVLALTLVFGLSPMAVSAENVEEESHKLADLFYEKIVYEYYDDVYATVYEEAVENGLFDDAIAQIDDLIAQVEEVEANIPEADHEDVDKLKEEIDLALDTLYEIKAILSGEELTTYEGLLENVEYLKNLLRERINSIELLWEALAEDPESQIDPDQLLKAIDIFEDVEHTIEAVYDEVYNARYEIAEYVYEPMCELLEIFLDTTVDSADGIADAIGQIENMSEEQIKERIETIVYEATHADYNITCDSYYVAFGNITDRNNYAKMLADELDVEFKNNSMSGMTVEELAETVSSYTADIEEADLITINFSEVQSVVDLIGNVAAYETEYGVDWVKYLGEDAAEVEAKIDDVLADLYAELEANGVEQKYAEAGVAAVEFYLYQYFVYSYNVHQVVSQIQEINPDALVVVVGVYNPLNGTTYTYEDTVIEVGSYLNYLFGAFGVYDLAYAILYDGVIFVDALEVEIKLEGKELTESLVAEMDKLNLQPSEKGHAYIQEQIRNALNISDDLEHVYGDWTVTKEPTCTETGLQVKVCEKCGHTVEEEIAALDHNYESVVTEPTCTEDGYTTHTCSVCGDSYVDSHVDALGHNYESVVTAPDCTEKGYTTHTCTVCGDSYVDSYVDALGHDWHWVVDKEATETEDGRKHEECSRCGEKRNETVIPATGNPKDGDPIAVFVALMAISAAGAAVVIKKKF